MEIEALFSVSPVQLRSKLPGLLAHHLTIPAVAAACEAALMAEVKTWSDAQVEETLLALREAGAEKRLYPAVPHCRTLSRIWSSHAAPVRDIRGTEHLREAAKRGPLVLLCNHASYIDSPLLDAFLWDGVPEIADRLVHVAGPKVYQAVFRRLAIVCLNGLPVQQSASVAKSGPDGKVPELSSREMLREVERTLKAAENALGNGYHLLLYPEGSRTRDGRMGPFLKGTFRYLQAPGTQVMPLALVGTGAMMGVAGDQVTPLPCSLSVGPAIDVAEAGGPRKALERAERAVAELLPESHRPL